MLVVVFFILGIKRHLATDVSLLYLTHSSLRYLIYDKRFTSSVNEPKLAANNFYNLLRLFRVYGKNT